MRRAAPLRKDRHHSPQRSSAMVALRRCWRATKLCPPIWWSYPLRNRSPTPAFSVARGTEVNAQMQTSDPRGASVWFDAPLYDRRLAHAGQAFVAFVADSPRPLKSPARSAVVQALRSDEFAAFAGEAHERGWRPLPVPRRGGDLYPTASHSRLPISSEREAATPRPRPTTDSHRGPRGASLRIPAEFIQSLIEMASSSHPSSRSAGVMQKLGLGFMVPSGLGSLRFPSSRVSCGKPLRQSQARERATTAFSGLMRRPIALRVI